MILSILYDAFYGLLKFKTIRRTILYSVDVDGTEYGNPNKHNIRGNLVQVSFSKSPYLPVSLPLRTSVGFPLIPDSFPSASRKTYGPVPSILNLESRIMHHVPYAIQTVL